MDTVTVERSLSQSVTRCTTACHVLLESAESSLYLLAHHLACGCCRNLRTICVTSSKDPVWPRFAAALAQQQLASLRELHIQHSSQTDAAHLEQLRAILQVMQSTAQQALCE